MPIYTKTGDKGETSLFGGMRISKDDIRMECIGSIDELNSCIGFAKIAVKERKLQDVLTTIQKDLYTIMGVLAGSPNDALSSLDEKLPVYESIIDTLDSELPELTDFIIPQGTESSTRLHIARTVCRRVERMLTYYINTTRRTKKSGIATEKSSVILKKYFNRLSDLLFIMARYESDEEQLAKA